MKTKILKILRQADTYISGQELCSQLGVSRTAVWKVIQQLKDEGYGIEAVSSKGYTVTSYPDVMTAAEIGSLLPEHALFSNIHYKSVVGSTNDEAKLMAENGAPEGTLVVTECQEKGKGRLGRTWVSPSGENIYMSFVLRPQIEPTNASMLTLIAAMAVLDAIHNQGIDAKIKWPNDIVNDGKKLCGILTEMSSQMECINYIVVGIGINVHQRTFDERIQATAASLDLAAGKTVKRSQVIADVLTAFEHYYQLFLKTKDLSLLKDSYNAQLVNMGKQIRIIDRSGERCGISAGIDDSGCLIAEIDGKTEHIMSGEVSVRGIYGYV